MIKERVYKGFYIFDIDSNGDNYESFKKGKEYIQRKEIQNSSYRGGFDTERFYFEYLGISIELTYSGFFGTELGVSESCSESEISKVRQWAQEIYDEIHKNENNVP